MLIIALAGNSEATKDTVVKQFSRHISASGVIFSMPPGFDAKRRMPLLEEMFDPARAVSRLMLINGLNRIDEFNWVRSIGGYIAHVDGRPSDIVPMQPNDFYVSHLKGGRGRFDSVEDCFSAIKLRYKQDAERRAANRAVAAKV